jgi:hypothetical protein
VDFLIVVEDVISEEEVRAEIFALRLWRCSGQFYNNQHSYGPMDVTVGFSNSEDPEIPLKGVLIIVESRFTREKRIGLPTIKAKRCISCDNRSCIVLAIDSRL